ncbi:hypothetical protein BKA57DRAFT_478145 [Linnemannia elongata]|nr:hypothetical protein BKA57DRAFT_478145 [Linnemannia elongata]
MQNKRIIVLVSLAVLAASTLADVTAREKREKWFLSGKNDCNGDPQCLEDLVSYGGYWLDQLFSENRRSPEIIFFRSIFEDDFCDYIPPAPEDSEPLCPSFF